VSRRVISDGLLDGADQSLVTDINRDDIMECVRILHINDEYGKKLTEYITNIAYRNCKREFLVAVYAIRQNPTAPEEEKLEVHRELMKVFENPSTQHDHSTKSKKKAEKGFVGSLFAKSIAFFKGSDPTTFIASYEDDLKFLGDLRVLAETDTCLVEAAQRLYELALDWGRMIIKELVDLSSQLVHHAALEIRKADNKAATDQRVKVDAETDKQTFIAWLNASFAEKKKPTRLG
jgi:hypothetical protein